MVSWPRWRPLQTNGRTKELQRTANTTGRTTTNHSFSTMEGIGKATTILQPRDPKGGMIRGICHQPRRR
ncbi:MAG: hypothetical protein NTV68_05380 [Methanomicrobiales archaeon]|nr:hypothetical protein [Methanomicrobiales archaeon]